MRVGSIAKAGLHLIAGCSLVLLVGAGAGTAFAHGGGGGHGGGTHLGNNDDHLGNGGHGRCVNCGDGHWGGEHHHHPKMAGNPPLHGPRSSHNPIVYHPVHGPGSSHDPIVTPVMVVRDHRTPPPRGGARPNHRCNSHNITGCEVRDHRTPPAPQCLGDLC